MDKAEILEIAQTLKDEVGELAKGLRKRAGYRNAEAAAEAVGVTPNSIYELERGENWISAEMLTRMCLAYKAEASDFFPRREPANPHARQLAIIANMLGEHHLRILLSMARELVGTAAAATLPPEPAPTEAPWALARLGLPAAEVEELDARAARKRAKAQDEIEGLADAAAPAPNGKPRKPKP